MAQNANGDNKPGLKNNPARENTVRRRAKRAIKQNLAEGKRYVHRKSDSSSRDDGSAGKIWSLGKSQILGGSKPSRYNQKLDNDSDVVNSA